MSARPGHARPLVSVVVPTLDRPVLLERALRAVLGQDYEGEIECLVVFDRPEVGVLPDLPQRPGRTVRSMTNPRTKGLAGARNTGILEAQGELVAFCDDDDEWLPAKLTCQVADLQAAPDHELVTCSILTVSEGRERERLLAQRELTHAMLLSSRYREAHSSTFLVRRAALLDAIGLVDEALPGSYGEDYDLLLRATRRAPVLVTTRPLVRITMHPQSYFKQDWATIARASRYLLERHPDLGESPVGLARVHGRLAIAEAALGNRRAAWRHARHSLALHKRQHRAYVGLAIALHLLSPQQAVRLAASLGRGI